MSRMSTEADETTRNVLHQTQLQIAELRQENLRLQTQISQQAAGARRDARTKRLDGSHLPSEHPVPLANKGTSSGTSVEHRPTASTTSQTTEDPLTSMREILSYGARVLCLMHTPWVMSKKDIPDSQPPSDPAEEARRWERWDNFPLGIGSDIYALVHSEHWSILASNSGKATFIDIVNKMRSSALEKVKTKRYELLQEFSPQIQEAIGSRVYLDDPSFRQMFQDNGGKWRLLPDCLWPVDHVGEPKYLFRSKALITIGIIIMGGIAAADASRGDARRGRAPRANSTAGKYKIDRTTFGFISFCSCMLIFIMMPDPVYIPKGEITGYKYWEQFQKLTHTLMAKHRKGGQKREETLDLLRWWDQQVFGNTKPRRQDSERSLLTDSDGDDELGERDQAYMRGWDGPDRHEEELDEDEAGNSAGGDGSHGAAAMPTDENSSDNESDEHDSDNGSVVSNPNFGPITFDLNPTETARSAPRPLTARSMPSTPPSAHLAPTSDDRGPASSVSVTDVNAQGILLTQMRQLLQQAASHGAGPTPETNILSLLSALNISVPATTTSAIPVSAASTTHIHTDSNAAQLSSKNLAPVVTSVRGGVDTPLGTAALATSTRTASQPPLTPADEQLTENPPLAPPSPPSDTEDLPRTRGGRGRSRKTAQGKKTRGKKS